MDTLCVGGPKHGERLAIPNTAYLNYYTFSDTHNFAKQGLTRMMYPDFETISCPVEKIRLGSHTRSIAIAPGISKETAVSYFFDVLVDAYDRHARKL